MLLIFLIYFIKKLVRVLYYYSFYGCNQEINYCSGQILQKSKLKQNKFRTPPLAARQLADLNYLWPEVNGR
jgi:hypothetical protein